MVLTSFATKLFQTHRNQLTDRINTQIARLSEDGSYAELLVQSSKDLQKWEQSSGKKQAYTPQELTYARLARESANTYQRENVMALCLTDAEHQAKIFHEILNTGLADKMMNEGSIGRKFGIVELSARLMPVLTFTGSSSYFEVGVVPYGKKSREAIGENIGNSFVSENAASESAKNLSRTFNVYYSLAETSAAPRDDVPKSGKNPEIFLCGIVGGTEIIKENHMIITPFRSEFNAVARELMYQSLKRIYSES
jgi:hypothetical protein